MYKISFPFLMSVFYRLFTGIQALMLDSDGRLDAVVNSIVSLQVRSHISRRMEHLVSGLLATILTSIDISVTQYKMSDINSNLLFFTFC